MAKTYMQRLMQIFCIVLVPLNGHVATWFQELLQKYKQHLTSQHQWLSPAPFVNLFLKLPLLKEAKPCDLHVVKHSTPTLFN